MAVTPPQKLQFSWRSESNARHDRNQQRRSAVTSPVPSHNRVARRRIVGAAATGGVVALAAACAPGTSSGERPATAQAPATLRFINVWDQSRLPLMEQQIADFNTLHPQITIQNELIPQGGMYDKYLAEIAAGSPADVIMVAASELPRMGKAAAVRSLDELVKRDKLNVTGIFYEAEAKLAQWEGKQFGLPQTVAAGNFFTFYNKQHFRAAGLPDRAPATWTEVVENARRLTKRDGDTFQQVGALFPLTNFENLAVVNGATLFSPDRKKVAFDSAEGLQALQSQLDAAETVYGGNARVADFRTTNDRLPQGARLRLMSQRVNGVWLFFQNTEEAPDVQWGAGPMPSNKDKNPKSKQTVLADGAAAWLYCIPTGVKQVEAAWTWLRYLTEGEGNKKFFFAQGRPSPARRWTEGQDYQKANPSWQMVVQTLNSATLSPPPPGYSQILARWNKMTGDVMARTTGVKDALDSAARDVQQILDQEWTR
jgi:multiple sugar transport system substrate-binding protein